MAQHGKCKWFNETKGYGFIAPDGGGADVFVHITALRGSGLQTLATGQAVSFDIEAGQNGKSAACNVKIGNV
jgi:CspA family cold shock protein